MVEFTFIDTKEEFNKLIEEIKNEPALAIDLECENNLHHYGVYITLIQISTTTKNYVLDILKVKEIRPLLEILENRNIQKIIHDISFDLRVLNYQFNISAKNIFDTQLAAKFLDKESLGLTYLLEEYFKIKKERKYQRVDWTIRPLTSDMLEYASNDTAHLFNLKEKLIGELKEQNKLQYLIEELHHIDTLEFPYHVQQFFEVKGARALEPKQLNILKVLYKKRDDLSKELNLPNFKIFSNKQLISFSQRPPYNWSTLRSIHPIIRKQAKEFAQIVNQAKDTELILEKQPRKKFSEQQKQEIDTLTQTRDKASEKVNLQAHMIASTLQIRNFILTKDKNLFRDWQKKLLEIN
jgi:ribonuclease D